MQNKTYVSLPISHLKPIKRAHFRYVTEKAHKINSIPELTITSCFIVVIVVVDAVAN
jgi:hypothetical protein